MADQDPQDNSLEAIATPGIEKRIYVIRGRQVMLDEDLADLYGVETRVLVQQVKRNAKRFPADFMFQLTKPEAEALRSQIVISNVLCGRSWSCGVPLAHSKSFRSGSIRWNWTSGRV
jgi:hypothetical protein